MPQKTRCSAFLSYRELKFVEEKSLSFVAPFLYEPCLNFGYNRTSCLKSKLLPFHNCFINTASYINNKRTASLLLLQFTEAGVNGVCGVTVQRHVGMVYKNEDETAQILLPNMADTPARVKTWSEIPVSRKSAQVRFSFG